MMSYVTIKNPVFKLYWAGWEADTLRLEREGWQISMEQDIAYCRMRIVVKHPQFQIYGISKSVDLDFYHFNTMRNYKEFPIVQIQHMASNLQVIVPLNTTTLSFDPISAVPEIVDQERKHIDDFKIFRPLGKVKEIVIAQPSVSELLDEIINKQDPKQAEIREKRRQEARRFSRLIEGIHLDQQPIYKPDEELVASIVAIH